MQNLFRIWYLGEVEKILIISDTHLSHIFQPAKFTALQRIISEADRVILNGDFWEGYLSSFSEFLNSPWQELFPLLREKEATYLYGNHDTECRSDERRSLFSIKQADSIELTSGGKTFLVQHGHRIAPTPGGDHPPFERLVRFVPRIEGSELVHLPAHFFKKYAPYNQKIKNWITAELPESTVLVTGHTHLAELDLENRFANSGVCKWHWLQYLTLTDGELVLHSERY
jgi:predicted phosphodiesterase